MSNRSTYIIAVGLLIFTFTIAIFSIKNDSLTMDELAHLPAGYSYLTQKDTRLNPEHPPLIKDLSALPLLFIKNIKFPSEIKAWKEDVNGQWIFGNYFLFKTGNPAEKMIFWARIPMILILVLLGFYIFRWTKEVFGNKAGLLALFLFSFSPSFLAHGRLVTTDVGAAAGFFIAAYYFVKFLQKSSKKNLIKAGLAFGLAELAKFSLILLIPFFGILVLLWVSAEFSNFKNFLKSFAKYVFFSFLIGLIALALIWGFYQYHTWNYPPERQVRDSQFILSSFSSPALAKAVIWMADKPLLRPLAQYLLGVFMVLQRASGGNTGYFMGQVSAAGWKSYFPVVYFIKEPLTFHILSLAAFLYLIWLIQKSLRKNLFKNTLNWLKRYFAAAAALIFIAIYWTVSLKSNLNIGVRHLLPIFPFVMFLSAGAAVFWLKQPYSKVKKGILAILLLWQAYSVLAAYPHFIAYFNEITGRPSQGYLYVTDSNLDWGQDLKRLNQWAEKNRVNKIYLDYFGGSDAYYYLKEKYVLWQGDKSPEELPKKSYLAVSATLLQGGRGKAAPGFNQPTGYYRWLNQYEPTAIIGGSIFVYYID